MENLVGQTLNRYRITALLGEGGMGAVYRAQDTALQRDVALKVMHAHYARRPDFQERFLQEARSAARLDHPGIIQVHDFGSDRGLLFIVMKFIPGENLEKMLRQMSAAEEWLLLGESVLLVRQVALALDYAHRQGVLHRDLKPSNLMLEPEPSDGLPYRPVITDLGLARLAEGGVTTQDGASMGTPAYMSPEQTQGLPTDARSDVYSLGILLFELATGRLPFRARTLAEAIRYHVQTPPPSPRSLRAEISEQLEQVILTALEKDPARRYQSAAQFAEALQAAWPTVSGVFSGPSPLVKAISLLTCYQQSLVAPRGPSIFASFDPAQPGGAAAAGAAANLAQGGSGDFIQVLSRDHETRTIPFKRPSMIVGRDPDCEIVLDDRKASRHHARLDFNAPGEPGARFSIVDLNSTNGTFLNAKRLPAGQAEPWLPDQALRIGDCWLRLLPAGAVAAPAAATAAVVAGGAAAATRMADPTAMYTGRSRLGISVEAVQYRVEPGKTVSIPVLVNNQGPAPDRFSLSVSGLPVGWAVAPSRPLLMNPGDRQQAVVTITPPRQPQSRAGRYPFSLRLNSLDSPTAESAEAQLSLEVIPYNRFASELIPPVVPESQIGRVRVQNLGNTPENYAFSWQDPAGALLFTPPGLQINLAEGQETLVEFRPSLRNRRWFGGPQAHPFSVQVSPASGHPQTINATLTSHGLIPVWLVAVLLFLCMLLAGGLTVIFGGSALASNQATRSAVAAQTGTMVSLTSTSIARTSTAQFLENANQATLQAVTATANWLNGQQTIAAQTNVAAGATLAAAQNATAAAQNATVAAIQTFQAQTAVAQQTALAQTASAQQTALAQTSVALQTVAAQTASAQQTQSAAATQTAVVSGATQTALAAWATQTAAASFATQTAQAGYATQTAAANYATQTAQAAQPQAWSFPAELSNSRTIYYLRLTGPGQIKARATWTGTQSDLALIINGPGQSSYYARQDGATGLEVSYTVTPADFAAGDTWRVSVASFGAGQADGTIQIGYPSTLPGAISDDFNISPTGGSGVALLALRGPGQIKAQTTWSGVPANLALIINGPGQVGYYARQDGGSPLQATYTTTAADLAAGNLWRVSIVSFSDTNLTGMVNLTYP